MKYRAEIAGEHTGSIRTWKFGILMMVLCSITGVFTARAQTDSLELPDSPDTPQLFAPGIISTDGIEYSITFSPDGETAYFNRRASWGDNPAIYVSRFEDGAWQEAEVAPFSGTYSDEYPSLSPDGKRLYFASKRPVEGSEPQSHNDIWYVEQTDEGWGAPQHLDSPINTEHIDSHPYMTSEGVLYFHSNRAGSVNIYSARSDGGRFDAPIPVSFNSNATDGEACIDPAGTFIIFYSERPGTLGKGDLFIVHREQGGWSSVINLGDRINTAEYEWTPSLSPDGRYLFYAHLAGNDSDIYQIDVKMLLDSL